MKVGTVQINTEFSGHYYLPYSIGLLLAYFKRHSSNPNRHEFALPIYKRFELSKMVGQLIDCQIVLFSTYVWNINISLAIAYELKRLDKDKLIVFGGPSAPDDGTEFLAQHQCVDILCHQEGERTATTLLDTFPHDEWKNTAGISYRDERGEVVKNNGLPRIRNLSELASPYLDGIFDDLMAQNTESQWLVSWETNRGCPFACTYCDWGSATNSKVSRMELDTLYSELEWIGQHHIEFVFVCDANFGMLSRDYDIAKKVIEVKDTFGYPQVLSVQVTKNARKRSYALQKLLYEGGLHKSINLAVQSTNETVLDNIKRGNISIADYAELQQQFLKDGIPTYSDLIIGLPGDNLQTFKNSIDQLVLSGQHHRVQFQNLSILPNAEMAHPDSLKKYEIETVVVPITAMHGEIDNDLTDGIVETQDLVVSNSSIDRNEWAKMRQFANAMEFYYYNKILQIPLLLLWRCAGKRITDSVGLLSSKHDPDSYPTLNRVNEILRDNAEGIVNGKAEFMYSAKWLGIYWPPGEYAILDLVDRNLIQLFYKEAGQLINQEIDHCFNNLIGDAISYNCFALKLPTVKPKSSLKLGHNIEMLYQKGILGPIDEVNPETTEFVRNVEEGYPTSRDEWARRVVWYGHRRASYLHGTTPVKKDIAGHY